MVNKFLTVLLLIATSLAHLAQAEVSVSELRVKAPIPGQSISAGYMILSNTGSEDIELVAVSSGAASRVEMHTHRMNDGMMAMIKLDSVSVPAGQTLVFEEGGHHLMVFDPDAGTIDNGAFDLIFEFDDGSKVEATGKIEHLVAPKAKKTSHQHH